VSVLRSIARVVIAIAFVVGAAIAFLRQPTTAAADRLTTHADPAVLERDVVALTSMNRCSDDPRGAAYIAKRFAENGARVSEQVYVARRRTYRNVIARFDGDGPPVIVGAHYDAFCINRPLPGADDNASGVAGLLELARIVAAAPRRPSLILVAYANEEPPFFASDAMGSAVHARGVKEPVRGMIALEMIGCFTARQPWPSRLLGMLYPARGDFVAVVGRWRDVPWLREVKRGIGAALPAVAFVGPAEWIDASDHRSYWATGIRAVMVTDTAYLRNPRYHTSADTAATLDYAAMARVVDGVANALR
jgi:Zn-dependent M28 family amino/carboxypeptidase